jgi:hypothetical protein
LTGSMLLLQQKKFTIHEWKLIATKWYFHGCTYGIYEFYAHTKLLHLVEHFSHGCFNRALRNMTKKLCRQKIRFVLGQRNFHWSSQERSPGRKITADRLAKQEKCK